MAQTNFTPILLYASSTPTNVPLAANLTNSATGSEIAINIADKNLFFKDSGGTVNTVPIRQSGTSSNGWLSSTDWNTFNGKAPATSGTSLLYGNGSGGFSNVTIGSGLSFAGGTLSATGGGGTGTVTSVSGTGTVNGLTLTGTVTTSGSLTLGGTLDLSSPPVIGGTTPNTITGTTINANTKVVSPDYYAQSILGGNLRTSGGTSLLNWDGGGSGNITVNGGLLANPSNKNVSLAPTGTGSVTINPATAGTINNMVIGGTTPLAITGTTITATTFSGSGASLTSIPNSALVNSAITINGTSTSLGGSISVGTVTSVTGTAPVVSSGGATPAISMAAATGSVPGYLTAADWTTFNSKQPAGSYLTAVSVVSANGFAGTSSGGTTPALTLSTSITGILKGNGTAISAATSGTDYAPATSGSSILYGDGAGGFSNVTIGSGLSFAGGTLSSTAGGGTVTSVAATVPAFLSISGSPITTSGTLAITLSGTALPVANGGTGQTTASAAFNALSPITSTGDLIIGNGTNSATRLAIGTNTYVLTSNGTTATWAAPSGGSSGPAFSAYLSSNQSVTSGTDTQVTLDTEEFDTNSNFASNRFTPTVAGYYQINGGVYLAGTANTQAGGLVYIYKNGSVYKQGSTYLSNTTAGVALAQVVSSIVYLNGSTDYVELWAQNQQAAARFSGGSSLTYFNGCYLRGT